MIVDIFKSFKNTIEAGIFVGAASFIVILLFIIMKIKEKYNDKENKRENKEKFQRNIDEIIEISKNWSTQAKIINCECFIDEYERLIKYRKKSVDAGYETITVITVYVNEKKKNFDMDIDGLYTLYTYLKNDIESRRL